MVGRQSPKSQAPNYFGCRQQSDIPDGHQLQMGTLNVIDSRWGSEMASITDGEVKWHPFQMGGEMAWIPYGEVKWHHI